MKAAGKVKDSQRTLVVCALLLGMFATLSYLTARTKSATYDETIHVAAAWSHWQEGDFRANPEHPPLWKFYAALPVVMGGGGLHRSAQSDEWWGRILEDQAYQWGWAINTLYRTEGNDAERAIGAMRGMMLIVAIGLGAMIAWCSWKWGGAVACFVATGLFALDPNFLAHASLMTNDVAFSLLMLACVWATWRVGERGTIGKVSLLAVVCAMAVTTKFSGFLVGPLVAILLLVRAIRVETWDLMGRTLATRWRRAGGVMVVCIAIGLVCYGAIWGVYLFRFRPTPKVGSEMNFLRLVSMVRDNELYSRHPGVPTTALERENWRPAVITRVIMGAEKRRLLPQAFLFGVLYVHMSSLTRMTFLLGQVGDVGWWYYFPLAVLFKTPLAVLIAGVGAFAYAMGRVRKEAVYLVVPAIFYALYLMSSNLNLGLRHMLPVYPFVYIAIGLVAAAVWRKWTKSARYVIAAVFVGLAVESLSAFPNFIPFFNAACGGSRGGIQLLGDSNLDWGQDLPALSQYVSTWRQSHPGQKFYLRYFGTADPFYYGIDYVNLPGGYAYGPPVQWPDAPGLVAISATHLQGIYDSPQVHEQYEPFRHARPVAIVGGSIYVFEFPERNAR